VVVRERLSSEHGPPAAFGDLLSNFGLTKPVYTQDKRVTPAICFQTSSSVVDLLESIQPRRSQSTWLPCLGPSTCIIDRTNNRYGRSHLESNGNHNVEQLRPLVRFAALWERPDELEESKPGPFSLHLCMIELRLAQFGLVKADRGALMMTRRRMVGAEF
jgi:hypothetical protein